MSTYFCSFLSHFVLFCYYKHCDRRSKDIREQPGSLLGYLAALVSHIYLYQGLSSGPYSTFPSIKLSNK